MMPKELPKQFFKNKILLGLIFIGSLSWTLTTFKSGLASSYGLGFWGANGHDGVWHVALANSLARGSLEMPTMAGEQLKNYHLGFDLLLAILHKITSIPTVTLYFQVLPPIMAILIGVLTYKFVLLWKKSETQALWSVFFVYFGGSWSWLLGKGESTFWSQQSISTLINPPFALSLIFLLFGLIHLIKLNQKNSFKYLIIAILSFGLLIQVKAYAGVLALGGLLISGIWQYFKNKNINIIKVFFGSLVLSVILFLPLNANSNGLVIWQPGWFLETMMGLSDRLNWQRFYSAMMNYKLANSPKLLPAFFVAFAVFWAGNLGIRIVKDIQMIMWIKNYRKVNFIEAFLFCVIWAAAILPMLFLQKGTPWNTIQFFYYSLFFSSIVAGVAVGDILMIKNKTIKLTLAFVIVFLTIPTTLISLQDIYLPARPPAMLTASEQEALKFLLKQPQGTVLTYPFDKAKADAAIANPPRPLYLYDSTAYVSAFANKTVFLEDEVNLTIMDYDWQSRRLEIEEFYKSLDEEFVYTYLRENKIEYIYWRKGQRATLGETQLGIERIFENNEVDIYKIANFPPINDKID